MVAELDYTCELRNIRCIEEDKSVKKVISFLMAVMMLVLAVSSVMAEETAAAPVSVTVIRMTAVKYYGETAVLKASVQNAEPSAQIRWQICPDYVSGRIDNWQEARTGETIRVELTYSSVNSGYRCILPTGEVSPVYTFSGITDAPVEEIIVEETVEEEVTNQGKVIVLASPPTETEPEEGEYLTKSESNSGTGSKAKADTQSEKQTKITRKRERKRFIIKPHGGGIGNKIKSIMRTLTFLEKIITIRLNIIRDNMC